VDNYESDSSNQFGLELPHSVYGQMGADVDGDTIGVHLPMSDYAQWEAENLMSPKANMRSAADGKIMHVPSHECLAGVYFATKVVDDGLFSGMVRSVSDLELMYANDVLRINSAVNWKEIGKTPEITCLGRKRIEQKTGIKVDHVLDKKTLKDYYALIIDNNTPESACDLLDFVQDLGYEISTKYCPSVCLDSFKSANFDKKRDKAISELLELENSGKQTTDQMLSLWQDTIDTLYEEWLEEDDGDGSMKFYAKAASRVSPVQVRQLVIAKGLQAKSDGTLVPKAVSGNYAKGLTVAEYCLGMHGARASQIAKIDITPASGYLTRRLVSAARDLYIVTDDCETTDMISIPDACGHFDSTGNMITKRGEAEARSPITCKAEGGICQKCYGRSAKTGDIVELGTAVGVIAGHSMSERIIQSSMKLKHTAGAGAARTDGVSIYAPTQGVLNKNDMALILGDFSYVYNEDRTDILFGVGECVEKGDLVAVAYPEIQTTVSKIDHFVECKNTGTKIVSDISGKLSHVLTPSGKIALYVGDKKLGILSTSPALRWCGEQINDGDSVVGGYKNLSDLYSDSPIAAVEYELKELTTLLSDTGLPEMQHIEMVVRAQIELVADSEGAIKYRRNNHDGLGGIKGLTRVNVESPSLLRNLGFGYTKQSIVKAVMTNNNEADTASENIMVGKFPIA